MLIRRYYGKNSAVWKKVERGTTGEAVKKNGCVKVQSGVVVKVEWSSSGVSLMREMEAYIV